MGSLKAGLAVPLLGSMAMFGLYLWKWDKAVDEAGAKAPNF
jgi:hypothetical protein